MAFLLQIVSCKSYMYSSFFASCSTPPSVSEATLAWLGFRDSVLYGRVADHIDLLGQMKVAKIDNMYTRLARGEEGSRDLIEVDHVGRVLKDVDRVGGIGRIQDHHSGDDSFRINDVRLLGIHMDERATLIDKVGKTEHAMSQQHWRGTHVLEFQIVLSIRIALDRVPMVIPERQFDLDIK